ncbi:MAG: aminotransferase class V-fold PLP-dependent enzyme [Rhodothermales bacterium]|nr:aminotransferase class V-fold PLP-dependent enzyme [Rhodothermales bacterium]MBO6779471.1 aminotransferase class V-fold PLP-dependent enzyme [Rhodothermales bacterium]
MLRERFPALARCTYLNTAGGAPIPDAAHAAAAEYYREAYQQGDVLWNDWMARVDGARAEVGGLVGCAPEHVAFTGNASIGLNLAAALDTPGKVAFAEGEFPSCTLPWLRRGFEPVPWRVREDGSFDGADVRWALRSGARTVVLSWVQFASGFRADLPEIAAMCADMGVRLVVDATQGIAAFPLDLETTPVDALVFSGYKWITSGYGVAGVITPHGFAEEGSPFAGWRSQEEPYALVSDRIQATRSGVGAEAGHPPFPGTFAMGASAALWNRYGPDQAAAHITGLVHQLLGRLDALGIPIRSTRDPHRLSGIVIAAVSEPAHVAAALAERGIVVSARRGGLRISVHAYNLPEEVDVLCDALAGILGRDGAPGLRLV